MGKNHSTDQHSGHKLMMLVCIAAAIIGVAYFFSGKNIQGSSWGLLMVLACPLMHLFMMKSHGHDQDSSEKSDGETQQHHKCH